MKINSAAIFFVTEDMHGARLLAQEESRMITQAVEGNDAGDFLVQQFHATTVEDFTSALRARQFDLVHLAAHGDQESDWIRFGPDSLLKIDHLRGFLQNTQPELRALYLGCCHSVHWTKGLYGACDSIIAVSGEADSSALGRFSSYLYRALKQGRALEESFRIAIETSKVHGDSTLLKVVLEHTEPSMSGRSIISFIDRQHSVRISIELVKHLIESSAEESSILDAMTRRIRLHEWLFSSSAEDQVLLLGDYCGVFSWSRDAVDITCHDIRRIDQHGLSDESMSAVFSMNTIYGRLRTASYRVSSGGLQAQSDIAQRALIGDFQRCLNPMRIIGAHLKDQDSKFSVFAAQVAACVDEAEHLIHTNRAREAILPVEQALSAIHQSIRAIVPYFTRPLGG